MNPSNRANSIHEYFFSKKLAEIKDLNDQGKDIINLGIGSPDLAPDKSVLTSLSKEINTPGNFQYQSYKGVLELTKAAFNWYNSYYHLKLDSNFSILPIMGSKEGINFLSLAYLDNGHEALIPNPGYPTYSAAIKLAGAAPIQYHLDSDTSWHPDLESLKNTVNGKTKVLFVNYPHMPTGQAPNSEKLQRLVEFAIKHGILICNDNPYSHILTNSPFSIFQLKGAEKCCVELNSISKSHSMAGARIGFIVGNSALLQPIFKIQSTFSSGMFKPLQLAAATALNNSTSYFKQINQIYSSRKTLVHELLDLIGCHYSESDVGLFVWAKIPEHYKNGLNLSNDLLAHAGVFVTPGFVFGSNGDQYIRVSLCQSAETLTKAKNRISKHIQTLNRTVQ